jgi:type IV pilus assembly protein PilB
MEKNALLKILVAANIILESEIENFIKESEDKKESIITTIVRLKKCDYVIIANIISQKFSLPFMDLDYYEIDNIPSEINPNLIEQIKVLPLKKNGNNLVVAVSNPVDNKYEQDIKFQLGLNVTTIIVEENKLMTIIAKYLQSKGIGFAKEMDDFDDSLLDNMDEIKQEATVADNDIEDAPVVKFIQMVLMDAIKNKVSDIHFEPYEKTYRVRFRLDGALYEAKKAPANLKEKIASRIKVISKMDISEKRIPQDGRMSLNISKDRAIDFRVSTLPTLWGEKIVMRILDSSAASLDIDRLGYDPTQKELLMNAVARPYGMVLVTGPTGSGKTVSLYSCLALLNKEDVNICTAEDPAEINLPGVNQVNMNEKAGLTFAAALKSFLRQDPDTILVGEIRDLETADIAIKAAQTGHMVLSTLHTNDAPKTITRLMNMGVKPFNIASSVILITAQRLARRLCPHCKAVVDIPEDVLMAEGMDPNELDGYRTKWHIYKPVGCNECNSKGYKGRVGIYQVMPITEEIRKIILNNGTDIDIAAESRRGGVYSLREAGLKKMKEGITSLEEVLGTTNID